MRDCLNIVVVCWMRSWDLFVGTVVRTVEPSSEHAPLWKCCAICRWRRSECFVRGGVIIESQGVGMGNVSSQTIDESIIIEGTTRILVCLIRVIAISV